MTRAWVVIAVVLQVIASMIPITSAQTSIGGDVVITTSGGRLRGTVSEYEPGVRVTIILPDGTSRTLSASEIASVTFADAAPVAAPVAPPTPIEPVSRPPTQIVVPLSPPAEAPVAVERWTESRRYAPSIGTPWVNADHELGIRRPRGDVHFGIQVEGGMQVAMQHFFYIVAVLPVGGAFAFLDVTAGETGTLRVGALFDVAGEAAVFGTVFRTVGVGGRVLGGHDVSDSVTLRAGVELQAVFVAGVAALEAEARLELAGRLLAARNLEIGGAITLGTTPNAQVSTSSGTVRVGVAQGLSFPGVTVFAAWVFE